MTRLQLACWLLTLQLSIVKSVGISIDRHSPPVVNITFNNKVVLVGSADGFVACGLDLRHSIWVFEYDTNSNYVNRDLYNGIIARSASGNVDVYETSEGCVQFGFKKIGFEHAGQHRLYDTRYDISVAAVLQVISTIELWPTWTSHTGPTSDGREPKERGFWFRFSGLMSPDLCANGSANEVSCSCFPSEQHIWTEVKCTLIHYKTALDTSFTASNCSIVFHVTGSYENASINTVTYAWPDELLPCGITDGHQNRSTQSVIYNVAFVVHPSRLSVICVVVVVVLMVIFVLVLVATVITRLLLKRRATVHGVNVRVVRVSGSQADMLVFLNESDRGIGSANV